MNGAVVAQNGTAELHPASPTDTSRPSPASLTTLPQILSALSSLQSEESELSDSLSQLLSSQQPILDSLARVQSLAPRIDDLYSDQGLLSTRVLL